MVSVAGGDYTIGRDAGDPLEQPSHTVAVGPFFIDRLEVTNAEYKKFVDATGHPAPVQWQGSVFPAGDDKLPVTGVTWQDASDYAEWAGKRLPTEVEWEAAARGNDARIYPWGNEWRPGIANIGSKPGKIEGVGKYPASASPSGALDMIGNVWEWTADEAVLYAGSRATITTEPSVTYRVIRGGAYDGDRRHDASYRGYLDASKPYPKVGFRCVKDAK
jgi:formylglycine-generating enzyme required for sulfatase activity